MKVAFKLNWIICSIIIQLINIILIRDINYLALGKRKEEEFLSEKMDLNKEGKQRDYFNLVKGKKKKGGVKIHKGTNLFRITLENGESFVIKSLVMGFVIGTNKDIVFINSMCSFYIIGII